MVQYFRNDGLQWLCSYQTSHTILALGDNELLYYSNLPPETETCLLRHQRELHVLRKYLNHKWKQIKWPSKKNKKNLVSLFSQKEHTRSIQLLTLKGRAKTNQYNFPLNRITLRYNTHILCKESVLSDSTTSCVILKLLCISVPASVKWSYHLLCQITEL